MTNYLNELKYFDKKFLFALGLDINKKYKEKKILNVCYSKYTNDRLASLKSLYFPGIDDKYINVYKYIQQQIRLQIVDRLNNNYLLLNDIKDINLNEITIYI